MNKDIVIARGSGHVLINQVIGDHSFYGVQRRESVPVHPLAEYARLVWDEASSQVVVRDTFMGVIPNEEYELLLAYKMELLETAKVFNARLTGEDSTILLTEHPYYCSSVGGDDYPSWSEYLENEVPSIDGDYNLLFRYDILKEDEYEQVDFPDSEAVLYLFYVLQRKGTIFLDRVHGVKPEDMDSIKSFLADRKQYLGSLWT